MFPKLRVWARVRCGPKIHQNGQCLRCSDERFVITRGRGALLSMDIQTRIWPLVLMPKMNPNATVMMFNVNQAMQSSYHEACRRIFVQAHSIGMVNKVAALNCSTEHSFTARLVSTVSIGFQHGVRTSKETRIYPMAISSSNEFLQRDPTA